MEQRQLCPKELPDVERGVSADVMLDIDPTYSIPTEQSAKLTDAELLARAEAIQEKDIRAQRLQEIEEKYEEKELAPRMRVAHSLGSAAVKESRRNRTPKISRRSQAWGYSASVSDPNLR